MIPTLGKESTSDAILGSHRHHHSTSSHHEPGDVTQKRHMPAWIHAPQRIKQAIAATASTPPPRHDHTTPHYIPLRCAFHTRHMDRRGRAKRTRARERGRRHGSRREGAMQPAVETRAAAAATGWHGSL